LHLESIQLTQFKNYETQHIQFSAKVNCIVGLNGMGKTNLLDAIYYLCMCKSQFGIADRLIVQESKEFFRLTGAFKKEEKSYTVTAKVLPRQLKEISLNGVAHAKLADHIGLFPVIMITPFDIDLAMEGSETRRRFLDNTLSQINREYLAALLKYNRILRQRNAALKSFHERMVNHTLLDSLDKQLLEPAQFIHESRVIFIESFLPVFKKYYQIIAKGQEEVNCLYKSQLKEQTLGELLAENREKDMLLQRSTVGIHKDDLQFKLKEHSVKKFASQGQLKSFILALKLAQYDFVKNSKKIPPLLLLDDIFDKLDEQRVQQLLILLFERDFGQIFFTDTQENRLVSLLQPYSQDICQLVIRNGEVVIGH